MKFTLKTPCADCPFRNDRPEQKGWLGAERTQKIIESIVDQQQAFACHKTTSATLGADASMEKEQHCAGALIMLEKLDRPNQIMRVAERCGKYNRFELKMDAPVFDTGHEFIEFHRSR